jgi:hypothetical protein
MIYISEENWHGWKYGDGPNYGRQTGNLDFFTFYRSTDKKIFNFKTELLNAAKSTLEHYPYLKPCIFFSGGLDSELILRSYLEIGSDPEVFIVRYENDYNLYDVSYALTICSILNVKYHLIDFNLQNFYENDALLIAEEAQIDRPSMLPHLKFTENVDGLIIVGHSDVRWFRSNESYKEKGIWLAQDFEHDAGCDKYNILHNRPAIYQWWKWTPGLMISYTQLKWFKKLIDDQYEGKLGINSTKILGFKEIYPDLLLRKKSTGFEKIEHLINNVEHTISKKYGKLPFRKEINRTINQFYQEITGRSFKDFN